MASTAYSPNFDPMQPGLRSFIVYDRLPAGCTAHMLLNGESEPHLRIGEIAVIDPAERKPAAGELALIQYSSRRPDEAHLHRVIVEMRQRKGRWIVSPVKPEKMMAFADGREVEQPLRFWDGAYEADVLSGMLIGRVVGILEPKMVEPALTMGK